MKNLFVPFELAKQLKKKGFDEPCFAWFAIHDKQFVQGNCQGELLGVLPTPLYQQVVDWFRIQHNIHIQDNWNHLLNDYFISIKTMNGELLLKDNRFKTYEECRIKAIEEVLKLI